MQFHVFRDANAVAEKGAEIILAEAQLAVSVRGQFTFAVSGAKLLGVCCGHYRQKDCLGRMCPSSR
jgi:hypothetical protein